MDSDPAVLGLANAADGGRPRGDRSEWAVNSIRPILEALEEAHGHFNAALFGGRLATLPVITVQTKGRKLAQGWYSAERWVSGTRRPAEINVCAEDLKRPAAQVLGTLLHDMVHQEADETGVQDTSRDGAYHNRRFGELAAAAGLSVPSQPDPRQGFARTSLGPEGSRARVAVEFIQSKVEPLLVIARSLVPPKPSPGKMLLFMCGCGKKIRCGRRELGAQCLECGGRFELRERVTA